MRQAEISGLLVELGKQLPGDPNETVGEIIQCAVAAGDPIAQAFESETSTGLSKDELQEELLRRVRAATPSSSTTERRSANWLTAQGREMQTVMAGSKTTRADRWDVGAERLRGVIP